MEKPAQIPRLAAGHAVIAAALGLSLLLMLPLAALSAGRLLTALLGL